MAKLETLGEMISRARKEREMSMGQLAKTLDVSTAFVSDLERERRGVSEEKFNDLANILKLERKAMRTALAIYRGKFELPVSKGKMKNQLAATLVTMWDDIGEEMAVALLSSLVGKGRSTRV